MKHRLALSLILAATVPACSQVAPSATGGQSSSSSQMLTPPPVSVSGYSSDLTADARSNYFRAGIRADSAYISNFYAGSANTSASETTISVLPSVALDTSTSRQHFVASYSPGFTFYTPSSDLNEVDHLATLSYERRLTPHILLNGTDQFQESSNLFALSNSQSSTVISGTQQPTTPGATPAFARQLTNSASAGVSIQLGLNLMVGASGLSTTLHYPNTSLAPGVFDSSSRAGTGFLSRRITTSQYIGAAFQYADTFAYPLGITSETETQTVTGFYTLYWKSKLSVSLAGGTQHYHTNRVAGRVASTAWSPSVTTSIGWQGTRTNFAANYSQSVTGGGGLLGAYHSRNAGVDTHLKISRMWTTSAYAAYSINKSIGETLSLESQDGHSVSGSVGLERSMGQHLSLRFQYARSHQSYDNVPAIASNPDSDRASASIQWQFTRPLSR
jgi:hypothetical protein